MEQDKAQGYQKFNNLSANTNVDPATIPTTIPTTNIVDDSEPKRVHLVRLVAVNNDKDHYFKVMNVKAIRRLVLVEATASILIVVCQIILYAAATPISGRNKNYKALDISGIGIWGPVIFFGLATGLSWLSTKSPSSCSIGTAMGFQIKSAVIALTMLILAIVSLTDHGIYKECRYVDDLYICGNKDHEVPGRIFCSLIILFAGTVFVLSIFVSILLCRSGCCCRRKFEASMIFDLEAIK